MSPTDNGVFNPAIAQQDSFVAGVLTRAGGVLQTAGAVVEGSVGILGIPYSSGASIILTAHAVDQGWAGLTAIVTGEHQVTVTYTVTKVYAKNVGMDENAAGWTAFTVDFGISLGADRTAARRAIVAGKAGDEKLKDRHRTLGASGEMAGPG